MNPIQSGFRPQSTLIDNLPTGRTTAQARAADSVASSSSSSEIDPDSSQPHKSTPDKVLDPQIKRDRVAVQLSRGQLTRALKQSSHKPGSASPSDHVAENLIYDVANIGDGVTSQFTTAFIADARKQVPKEYRDNPLDAQGRFNLITIGLRPGGVGRAYTEGVGYSADEPANLLDYQMEFTHGKPNPIDGELLKLTLDLDDRRLSGLRPFQFKQPHVEPLNGLSYSLREDHENPYSFARFRREMPATQDASHEGRLLRRTYNSYVQHTLRRVLNGSKKVRAVDMPGEVVGVRYDEHSELFELRIAQQGARELRTVKARNVVLATGHEGDTTPEFLRAHMHSKHVYSGERITELTAQIRQHPEQFRNREGLIIGSGLTMNDVARTLQDFDCNTFNVVSRHGHTHELPQDVPSIPELEPALESIYDALHLRNLLSHLGSSVSVLNKADGVDEFVAQVKSVFTEAKNAISGWEPECESLTIRGQSFDPVRVTRALLAQYMLFRYEGLRGQALREAFGNEVATGIVRRLMREVDAPNAAWITASRTSTTDENIACNQKLRDGDQLWTDQISAIKKLDEGFRVEFASGRTRDVSYIANCTGRIPDPARGLGEDALTQDLVAGGLIQPHGLGFGVAMDASGRATPDPRHFIDGHRPNLFIASLAKAKGELIFPINRDRDPLSNVVAESVLALRPLARQIGRAIVDGITQWKHTPDHRKDFIYNETEVSVEDRDE